MGGVTDKKGFSYHSAMAVRMKTLILELLIFVSIFVSVLVFVVVHLMTPTVDAAFLVHMSSIL